MTDIHTRKLCTEIIHWHFGPFASELTSILLTRGRLRLAQLIHLSKLKPRTARACILVLIQQNILWHSKEDDDTEVFEINMDECLMRLRFGRFIWLSQQLFGQIAAEIVQVILDHGKLRSSDVRHLLHICENKKISQYNQIFRKLVTGLYLKPSTVLSHESLRDRLMQYETEERRKISGFPTAKELRQAKEIAVTRLRSEQEKEERIGLKRKAKDQSGPRPNKRKTLDTEEIVDDTVYFKVNYEKFNIHIRNLIIERAVKERYNKGASTVVNAILKTTEAEQLNLSEPRTPPISVTNIMMQIPEDAHFADGLVYSSKKKPTSTYVKDYLGMLSSADNPSPDGRSASFISYSTSKVQVEFELIARKLRRNVVEAVAREKHGAEGVRIVRLLLSTEKLDEKQISKMVMMAPKDVRPLLANLSADSLISIQEVPKSADRNPTRTFYLWYIDLQKASSVILDSVYKTLYNIIARRRAEREFPEVSAVLEKRQRSDVSQDENLLTRLEREVLESWEAKEEKLAGIGIRVEEIVFILKDLASLCSNE